MRPLRLLLVTLTAVLLPIIALAQTPTRIDDVKQLAGEWEGWLGNVLAGIQIKEDGSYQGIGVGGQPVAGQIVVKDGRASYKSNLTEGSIYLYELGGRSTLRFVTLRGGVGELQRTK